jgi:hypothetical protein
MTSNYMTQVVTFIGRRPQLDPFGFPVEDRYGNDVYADAAYTVERCTWEPRAASEEDQTDDAEQVTDGLNLYTETVAADVRATDRAVIDGLLYEVVGRPARFTGSRFGNDYAAIRLERVTG